VSDINWADRALESEIAYSKALGSKPAIHPGFVHLHNEAVPWGGDFNCAVGVQLDDMSSFCRIVEHVERIHRKEALDRPDRYDVYPPALEETLWRDGLAERGYVAHRSIWFSAPVLKEDLPAGFALHAPDEDEYIAWYHARQRAQDWYNEADFARLRPLQQGFTRVFRPYWLRHEGRRVGWVYCGCLEDVGRLFDVWIEPSFRGQGLGRVLMNAIRIEGHRRNIEWVLLRTSKGRRGFYERCGLRECLHSSVIRRRKT
jgi:GNAT superfamily N-acetyltransferase